MASSVRQFPTIKAVRSFVIGGVGSGAILLFSRWNIIAEWNHDFQVATTTTSKAVTGTEPNPYLSVNPLSESALT
jgi:hypothetical protein